MTPTLSSVNPSAIPWTLLAVTSRAKVVKLPCTSEIDNFLLVEVLKTVIKDTVMSAEMQEAVDTIQFVLGMILLRYQTF